MTDNTVSNAGFYLHVVRNPHGHDDRTIRVARNYVADALECAWQNNERLEKANAQLAAQLERAADIVAAPHWKVAVRTELQKRAEQIRALIPAPAAERTGRVAELEAENAALRERIGPTMAIGKMLGDSSNGVEA